MVSDTLLADAQEVKYLPSGLSDHALLEITLRVSQTHNASVAPRLSHPGVTEAVPPLLEEDWGLNLGSAPPSITWDAFKACAQGHYIAAIAAVPLIPPRLSLMPLWLLGEISIHICLSSRD